MQPYLTTRAPRGTDRSPEYNEQLEKGPSLTYLMRHLSCMHPESM